MAYKGKASVTLRGTGNYGGMKTVKFEIGTKGLFPKKLLFILHSLW